MSDEERFEQLREHYESPQFRRRLEAPTHVLEIANPLCGDEVRLEVRVAEGVVREVGFTGKGCVISQASASMLVQHIAGRTIDELQAFREIDMLTLIGVRLLPNRQRCALLAWSALRGILTQLLPQPP